VKVCPTSTPPDHEKADRAHGRQRPARLAATTRLRPRPSPSSFTLGDRNEGGLLSGRSWLATHAGTSVRGAVSPPTACRRSTKTNERRRQLGELQYVSRGAEEGQAMSRTDARQLGRRVQRPRCVLPCDDAFAAARSRGQQAARPTYQRPVRGQSWLGGRWVSTSSPRFAEGRAQSRPMVDQGRHG